VRKGEIPNAPDLVIFPESHADVEKVISAAHKYGVRVVPFAAAQISSVAWNTWPKTACA